MSAATVTSPDRDVKGNLFIAVVIAAGAAAIGESLRQIVAAGLETRQLAWLGLAVLTLLAGRLSVKLPLPQCRLSLSDPFIFLSVLVFGGHLATLTAALDGFAASAGARGTGHKRAFNTAGMAISVYLSSRAATWMVPRLGAWGLRLSMFDLVVAVSALAFVQYLVNTALVSTVVALKEHVSLLSLWRDSSPWAGSAHLAASVAAAIVFLVVRALGAASAFAILPFPIVLFLAYRAFLKRPVAVKGGTTP